MKQYLAFNTNTRLYLFSIDQVHSIIKKKSETIRYVPEVPPYFTGLTQLRENTIGIIDASMILDAKRHPFAEEYNIVVVHCGQETYGILVNEVIGVKNVEEDEIKINNFVSEVSTYVDGIYNDDDTLYLIVDANRFINVKQIKEFKPAVADGKV